MVTLFILYEKSFFFNCLIHYNTESQLWSTQWKILLATISLTKAGEAEQTAYLLSEQTRSCTVEEKPEKKMGQMKLEDIFQHEHAMAKKFCNEST